jgi:hypothetical protein
MIVGVAVGRVLAEREGERAAGVPMSGWLERMNSDISVAVSFVVMAVAGGFLWYQLVGVRLKKKKIQKHSTESQGMMYLGMLLLKAMMSFVH